MASMNHRRIAAELTTLQRNCLIKHIDRGRKAPAPMVAARNSPKLALIRRKLLRYDRPSFPTETWLTEDGRQVLSIVLGEYADALVRAGFTGIASPIGTDSLPMVAPQPGEYADDSEPLAVP